MRKRKVISIVILSFVGLFILYVALGELLSFGSVGIEVTAMRKIYQGDTYVYVAVVKNKTPFFRMLEIYEGGFCAPRHKINDLANKSILIKPMGIADIFVAVERADKPMWVGIYGDEYYILPTFFGGKYLKKRKDIDFRHDKILEWYEVDNTYGPLDFFLKIGMER